MSQENHPCVVCGKSTASFFMNVEENRYHRCHTCLATFLDPAQRISIQEEHQRYQLHNNDINDERYRLFLSKIAVPLLKRLPPNSRGIDYGCGPGPALAAMIHEAGHQIKLFDPLFFPTPDLLEDQYDFITCTETIEHFHRPDKEFARFNQMLRPGGWLALMTSFQTDDDRFGSWHYRRDPTHVVFYKEETLRYIARQFGWDCEILIKDIALMQA